MKPQYEQQIGEWVEAGVYPRIVHLPHAVTAALMQVAGDEAVSMDDLLQEGAARILEDRELEIEEL